jgi:hypothetical protein
MLFVLLTGEVFVRIRDREPTFASFHNATVTGRQYGGCVEY